MSKWKCEIYNSEFENFQAQGFNNKIYCPLCYFKELNNRKDKKWEDLKNYLLYYMEGNLKYDDDTIKEVLRYMGCLEKEEWKNEKL